MNISVSGGDPDPLDSPVNLPLATVPSRIFCNRRITNYSILFSINNRFEILSFSIILLSARTFYTIVSYKSRIELTYESDDN